MYTHAYRINGIYLVRTLEKIKRPNTGNIFPYLFIDTGEITNIETGDKLNSLTLYGNITIEELA